MGGTSSSQQSPTSSVLSTSENSSSCPMKSKQIETNSKGEVSQCPMNTSSKSGTYKNPSVYNVYNQKIDPTNQMPTTANQHPSPEQSISLSTERVVSNIPKAGTDSTWLYPSAQMFWNALVRKNKLDGVSEEDVDSVISIHNNMNENTWKQVLVWESLQPKEEEGDRQPKLLRFLGRPDDLSPKARMKMLFGHPKPFDRHDWIVDRGGREVRYVIDYYHDESETTRDRRPSHLSDIDSIRSILVDVRPAVDSWQALYQRVVTMPWNQWKKNQQVSTYRPPPFFAPSDSLIAETRRLREIENQWQEIMKRCAGFKQDLRMCQEQGGRDDCGSLSVKLQRCTASVVCPEVVEAFDLSVGGGGGGSLEETGKRYSNLVKCLELFEIESKEVLQKRNNKG